jgi:hypothetical protein
VKLSYSIKVDIPEQSDEYEVYIDGIGTLRNHTTTDLNDLQVATYRSYHHFVDHEYDSEGRITLKPQSTGLEEATWSAGIAVLVDGKEVKPAVRSGSDGSETRVSPAALQAIIQMLDKVNEEGVTE